MTAGEIKGISGIVIDCRDENALCDFYQKLLEWPREKAGEGWAALKSPVGFTLAFQRQSLYEKPVWPYEKGRQGQMIHLDFKVENLEKAVERALSLGAELCETQYFESSRTMRDIEGHTFCLDLG